MNATALVGGPKWRSAPDDAVRAPSFHRRNGRILLLTAFAASATGLHLVWSRGTLGPVAQNIGTSVDAM